MVFTRGRKPVLSLTVLQHHMAARHTSVRRWLGQMVMVVEALGGQWMVCPSCTNHLGLGRDFARTGEDVLSLALPASDVTHFSPLWGVSRQSCLVWLLCTKLAPF